MVDKLSSLLKTVEAVFYLEKIILVRFSKGFNDFLNENRIYSENYVDICKKMNRINNINDVMFSDI